MIRERDWTGHPLGPPETWPPELRTALSLVLNSPESMILAWGRDLIFFFNETYFPLLGPRLPWAMGERFDKVWADGWDQAKPIIDDAFAGRSTRFNDLPWTLDTDRGDAMTWWSFSYSRILDADGQIAGLFILTNETTERVKAERRQRDFEDALRAERDRAHDVLDNMGEAFALLGRDMTIADINAEGLRMDGRGPDEIVGRPYREAYPDADPVLEAAYRKALSDGKPFTMEHAAPAGTGASPGSTSAPIRWATGSPCSTATSPPAWRSRSGCGRARPWRGRMPTGSRSPSRRGRSSERGSGT